MVNMLRDLFTSTATYAGRPSTGIQRSSLSEYDAVHEVHVRNAEVLTGKTAIFQIKEEEPLPPKEGDGISDAERLMAIEYIQSRIKQGEKALASLRVIERMICDGED